MSLSAFVKSINLREMDEVQTVPATYAAGAHTIFTIQTGLVRIHGIYCYCNTALDVAAAGSTFLWAINGVAMNAPAFAVTGTAIGDVLVCPLGAFAVAAAAAAQQSPNVAALTAFSGMSIVAGPVNGLIQCTVGVAGLGAAELCTFYCLYQRVDPSANIV